MDHGTTELARAIGTRLREHRTARGWTLDRLATAAGVSRRMVVNVEQGTTNPSVGTLLRLAEALGVGLPALVEPATRRTLSVTRHGEGAVLWRGTDGGRGVLVASGTGPDVAELWDWRLAPGEVHESEPHTAGSEELLHVLAGAVTVTVAGEEAVLDTGDAVSFAADVAHSYRNHGSTPATFALAVAEPVAEATTTRGGR